MSLLIWLFYYFIRAYDCPGLKYHAWADHRCRMDPAVNWDDGAIGYEASLGPIWVYVDFNVDFFIELVSKHRGKTSRLHS